MAAIKKVTKHGRVRWRCSYYDAFGQRHQRFFATKAEAADHQADAIKARKQKREARVDRRITVREYVAQWLPAYASARHLKIRTTDSYDGVLRTHVLPALGDLPVAKITRAHVEAILTQQRAEGGASNSVCLTHSILSLVCAAAVKDGLLVVNPTLGLRKDMRLGASAEAVAEAVRAKAMDQHELDRALTVARTHSPLFKLYVVLARTGLRIGEALALEDADLDLDGRQLRVERQLGPRPGETTPPKSGYGRSVDLSRYAVTVLREIISEKKKAKLAGAWPELPVWMFPTSTGGPYSPRNVLRDWHRVQSLAGLLDAHGHPRFGLHAFRHSFASLHIVDRSDLTWLQEQMGHADIRLTRSIYGSAFKLRDLAAADRQDARSRLVVTAPVTEAESAS